MKTKKTIKEELEKIFSKETIDNFLQEKITGGDDTQGVQLGCIPPPQQDVSCIKPFALCVSICL